MGKKSGFKCELCHKHNAKYQYFETDGRELYICGVCRNRRLSAFAPELLAILEKVFPKEERHFKVSERNSGESQDARLCTAVVFKLLQIKSKFRTATNVLMIHPVALPTGQAVGAFVMFIPSERRIMLEYTVMDDGETVLSHFDWEFDASDPEHGIPVSVKWKFTMDGEKAEQEYGIGNIPFEIWKQCISVVNMLDEATPNGSMKIKDFLDGKEKEDERCG